MTNQADDAPASLLKFLLERGIDVEFVTPGVPMPTVVAAAAAIGVPEEQILKTVLFAANNGAHVVAIANGTRRIDLALLAEAAGVSHPRAASPAVVRAVTGYPAGGVAPLGLPEDLTVIVDERVTGLPVAFAGGGNENVLLKLDPADIILHNHAKVAAIVEEP